MYIVVFPGIPFREKESTSMVWPTPRVNIYFAAYFYINYFIEISFAFFVVLFFVQHQHYNTLGCTYHIMLCCVVLVVSIRTHKCKYKYLLIDTEKHT